MFKNMAKFSVKSDLRATWHSFGYLLLLKGETPSFEDASETESGMIVKEDDLKWIQIWGVRDIIGLYNLGIVQTC